MYSPNLQAKMPERGKLIDQYPNYNLLLSFLLAILPSVISCSNSISQAQLEFQLTSNSMAPTIWGPKRLASCPQCNFQMTFAAETVSNNHQQLCPICGKRLNMAESILPGEIVTARCISPDQAFKRLDCIAFVDKTQFQEENWIAKRVWGLPGELIAFEQGELVVNGTSFQKSFEQLRQVAIPVSTLPEETRLFWSVEDNSGQFSQLAETPKLQSGETLVFRPKSLSQPAAGVVYDDYQFNQETPRSLVPVNDLLFDFVVRVPNLSASSQAPRRDKKPSVEIVLAYDAAEYLYQLELQQPVASTEFGAPFIRILVAGWDGGVQLSTVSASSIDSNKAISPSELMPVIPISKSSCNSGPTSIRLRVNQTVEFGKIRVYRDIYLRYSDRDERNGLPNPTEVPLDHYYLIGDNLPISIDSRNGLGCVHESQIQALISNQ